MYERFAQDQGWKFDVSWEGLAARNARGLRMAGFLLLAIRHRFLATQQGGARLPRATWLRPPLQAVDVTKRTPCLLSRTPLSQVVEVAESELGGCKLASAAISGRGAVYGHLKFESGIHRVQRVPVTESGALRCAALHCAALVVLCCACCFSALLRCPVHFWPGRRPAAGRMLYAAPAVYLHPAAASGLVSTALCRRAHAHQHSLGGGAAPGGGCRGGDP